VLVVGAGPVGLGAALELARNGVRSIVFEKHPSTSWHPKTRNFNTRTMEIARGWGLATYQRLRSIDTPPGWKSPIRFTDTLTGTEHGRIDSKGFEGPGPTVSPAEPIMTSQELIEEILLDAVRATGMVDVRFSTEVTRLVRGGGPDDTGAVVEVRAGDRGSVEHEGPALIAADGASSFVRNALGLELVGHKDVAHLVNCYFRADIEHHLRGRRGVLFFVANPRANGVLQPLDGRGRWLCQITVAPEDWSLEAFTPERATRWVRDAVGVADLHVEVLSIGLWQLNAAVVERMVQGHVVLCGDAAHQFPPTGGLGVNAGLQGMHNVMWKLAWYLHGHASWSLVETYETERRPVSERITRQSFENSLNVARIRAAIAGDGVGDLTPAQIAVESRRYGNHLGVEFGSCYTSSAVIDDGTTPPTVGDDYSDYLPSATPGARAPHQWLGRPESRLSTLDLVGSGLTLLAGPDGDEWRAAAARAHDRARVPIGAYVVDRAGLADLDDFCGAYGIAPDGAVLVRPDGHVAWRRPTGRIDADMLAGVVDRIRGRVHGRAASDAGDGTA
jgi:2-polyprenyl-6-methoxyphenol hydroxylase-like FAD-dependent oxidoreductase